MVLSTNNMTDQDPGPALSMSVSATKSPTSIVLKAEDYDIKEGYRVMLNETIANAQQPNPDPVTGSHPPRSGQVGMTWWTSEDKHRLFEALVRYGPYDLEHLQSRLPNQSEVEIQQLIQLLRAASDQHYMYASAKSLVKYRELPAAVELPDDLCEVLETEADKVQSFQLGIEENVESKRFGKYWLLDSEIVEALEKADRSTGAADGSEHDLIEVDEIDSIGRDRLRPALDLLNLQTWLEVSETIFNNAPAEAIHIDGYGSNNTQAAVWQLLDTSCLSQYKSSIFATAFSDFHSVLVSLTRRFVCTTIFQAQSRLRATDVRGDTSTKSAQVTIEDVYTALDVLGMPRNAKMFWASAPRKHQLEVYDYEPNERADSHLHGRDLSRVRDLGRLLSYDEVESRLGLVRPGHTHEDVRRDQSKSEDREQRSDRSEVQSRSTDFQVALQASASGYAPSAAVGEPQPDYEHYLPDETESDSHALEQENLAEAFDHRQNKDETQQIWVNVLHEDPPGGSDHEDISEKSEQRMYAARPTLNDLQNWREKSPYKPEWETFGCRVPYAEPRAEVKKRKRSWSQNRRANYERNKRRRLRHDEKTLIKESATRSDDHYQSNDGIRPPERGRTRNRRGPGRAASTSQSGSRSRSQEIPSRGSSLASSEDDDDEDATSSSSLANQRGRRSTRSSPISYAIEPLEDADAGGMLVDDGESSADDWVPNS